MTKPVSRVQTPRLLGETNPRLYALTQTMLPNGPSRVRGAAHPLPLRICPDHIAFNLIEQAGYSRLHRRIFLLINGRRNTVELARLVGREDEEVQQILLNLEQIRVIRR